MSWHLMMEFMPPSRGLRGQQPELLVCQPQDVPECVINYPAVELAETVVACGNTSGRSVDKFMALASRPCPPRASKPRSSPKCYASLECKVRDGKLVAKYNFFILEVVQAWIDPARKRPRTIHHKGEGEFMVAGPDAPLPSPKTSFAGK